MSNDSTGSHRNAYHLAAHAVAEYRHGGSPRRISARADERRNGCHRPLGGSIDPEVVSDWVTVSLAGMAAEMELGGEPLMTAVARSPEALTNVVDVLHLHRLGPVKERLKSAREFVSADSGAIRAVADQLLERGVLDGLEVELIVDRADGLPGAAESLAMIRASGWDAASQDSAV